MKDRYLKPDEDKRTPEQKADDRVRLLKLASKALEDADLEDVMFVAAELGGVSVARYAAHYGDDLLLFADALNDTKKFMSEVAGREFSEPGKQEPCSECGLTAHGGRCADEVPVDPRA
jgi:hypothetical protein